MVEVRFDKNFVSIFSKIKDNSLKEKISKQIKKISDNPEIGKPMRYDRKGTRELYVKPFRLSYSYLKHQKNNVCDRHLFLGCSEMKTVKSITTS